MNFLRDIGKTPEKRDSPEMSRPDSSGSGKQYLGYFKTTPFAEAGVLGYRKQHRDVLNDDCHKYYGAVKNQNEAHNGKTLEAACERSINYYNEIMEDGLKVRYRDDGTMDEKEIETLHEFALQKSVDKFHEIGKLGPEHIWRECRDRIMEKCKTRFNVLNSENEERNKQVIEKAKQKSFAKYRAYVDAIVKVRRDVDEMIGEQELKRVHEEAMRAALGTYDMSSIIGNGGTTLTNRNSESKAIDWWN